MAVVEKSDTCRTYHFKVNAIYINLPGNSVKLADNRLLALTIEENYLQNMYPIIRAVLILEQSLYNSIIKNKDSVKFNFDIRKFYDEGNPLDKSSQSKHLNVTYQLILDDAINTINTDTHNLEFPEGDMNELMAGNSAYEIFLFSTDLIRSNVSMINLVLEKASVVDALGYLMKQAGVRKNLIMPQPNNGAIYNELVIPPMKLSAALQFLDAFYGIFDTGTIIFFSDVSYVLPYCKRCNAVQAGQMEEVNIVIPKVGSQIFEKVGSVVKHDQKNTPYIIADPETFTPTNQDVTGRVLQAEEIQIVDNDKGMVTAAKNKNKKVVVKPGENPYYAKIYKTRLDAMSTVITVMLKNCDISVVTPNKAYQFLFEDTKLAQTYKGYYHLVSITTAYTADEDNLVCGAQCTFHKSVGIR